MKKNYAKVLDTLIRVRGMREADAYRKLHKHLERTGRLKLLPQLLQELRTLARRQQSRGPLLEAASEKERKEAEEAARKSGATVRARVNPSLIRGWRLTSDGMLTDRSGKRALIDLYRAVTRSNY